MVRRWKLPEPLREAIAFHHKPSQAGEGKVLACAVHIADAAMMMLGIGIGRDGLQYELDPVAIEVIGWKEDDFNQLTTKILPLIEEAKNMLGLQKKG
jgi:HD-like signal output (HDOD) protein